MPTVLIAEDEPEIRDYLGLALRCEGYKVEFACDGEEVVHHLERNSHGVSLLANYTWGKAIDSWSDTKTLGGARAIPTNSRYDIGPADYDRRHVINVTSIVHIPAPTRNAFAKAVLGGWEHTLIFNYQRPQ